MTLSTLARSVVDQVLTKPDLSQAFLLEQALQTYKINGVVDYLKRTGDFNFSNVIWLTRHKRPGYSPLLLSEQLFAMIQGLDDFTWSLWGELCSIDPQQYYILSNAIDKAKFTVPSLSYALTIFKSDLAHVFSSVILQRQADEAARDAVRLVRNISNVSHVAWADMRDRL